MTAHRAPPLIHLGLLALALVILLIGGTATFGSWGTVDVRLVAVYLTGAIAVHAASRFAPALGTVLRGTAWAVLAAGAVHSGVLARIEVLVPLAVLAVLDLAVHKGNVEAELKASTRARIVAGVATLAAIVSLGALVLLARDAQVLLRLGATMLVAWGIVTTLALRPGLRTPRTLLAGAGALSLTFVLLAAPVLPFGPLLAYWTTILSMAAAVATGAISHTGPGLDPERRRHAQRVQALPDPVIGDARESVRAFLATGVGARLLSERVEAARGRKPTGRLLPALTEARAKGTRPSRTDRLRALAEALGVEDRVEALREEST